MILTHPEQQRPTSQVTKEANKHARMSTHGGKKKEGKPRSQFDQQGAQSTPGDERGKKACTNEHAREKNRKPWS